MKNTDCHMTTIKSDIIIKLKLIYYFYDIKKSIGKDQVCNSISRETWGKVR